MNTSYICIILATIIVTIIIIGYVCYKNKEKFTKVDGLVQSSDTVVASTIPKATNYMSTNKDGAISTDPNINVNSLINIGGYPGKVGDVIVSNGSAPRSGRQASVLVIFKEDLQQIAVISIYREDLLCNGVRTQEWHRMHL